MIPAVRMKADRAHDVPLSDQALAILADARKAHPKSRLIFPGTKGQALSDMTFTKRLRDMKLADRATAHGFRSSFKDWASENGIRDEVSEAALAHTIPDKVRAAYLRTRFLEERRTVMQQWADHCCGCQ